MSAADGEEPVDEIDEILWGAVADMELAHYTKREIAETLRRVAAQLDPDDTMGDD